MMILIGGQPLIIKIKLLISESYYKFVSMFRFWHANCYISMTKINEENMDSNNG